jgi:tetratricopeptide (TPR) repeat protein
MNLFPHQVNIDGMQIPSDGLQMLNAPFLSRREIAGQVAIELVIDGQNWEHRGNYEKAIESFSQAIHTNPDCVQAYQQRGNVYQILKKYQRSRKKSELICN